MSRRSEEEQRDRWGEDEQAKVRSKKAYTMALHVENAITRHLFLWGEFCTRIWQRRELISYINGDRRQRFEISQRYCVCFYIYREGECHEHAFNGISFEQQDIRLRSVQMADA